MNRTPATPTTDIKQYPHVGKKKAEPQHVRTLHGVAAPSSGKPGKRSESNNVKSVDTKVLPLEIANAKVRRNRFFRAYLTTFQVCFSYLWIVMLGKVLGTNWTLHQLNNAHPLNAKRVQTTIVQLQGLFIKVGQLLSIMANFLPEAFRSGLQTLQDSVPPRPFEQISQRIELDFGKPVDELFDRFNRHPIASASLGQVHEAYLPDGTHVAVKIQHKDIDEICNIDLRTIRRIMKIVSFFFPIKGLELSYKQIRDMVSRELDYDGEANSIEQISANFAPESRVRFPKVMRDYCTQHVLTTTFIQGIKIGDTAKLNALGIDKRELAERVIRTYCQMIFVDGVYHADPHPGNMLVTPDGELVLLDFGATAALSQQMREGMSEFVEAALRRDTDKLIRAIRKMGFISNRSDVEVSEKVIEYFHERFQQEVKLESFNLKDIQVDPLRGFENLIDLRKMNVGIKELSGSFQVPGDWVLLERTLLLLMGLCTELDRDMNPMDVVRPYLRQFVFGSQDWTQIIMETASETVLKAASLPGQLSKYLHRAMRGELDIRVREVRQGTWMIYRGLRQLTYAAFCIALGFSALQLYLAGKDIAAAGCLVGAALMLLLWVGSSIWVEVSRR